MRVFLSGGVEPITQNPTPKGAPFYIASKLSERVQAACRAAGVFRDFETVEQLHTWAKKRFIESYLAWEMLEQNQFLLPHGQLKNLLSDLAKTKAITALPPSVENDLECSR